MSEPTGFRVDEFGLGFGNVFEESMNTAGTSSTVEDFLLTPFGDKNITPTVDPSVFGDLLSSIGL